MFNAPNFSNEAARLREEDPEADRDHRWSPIVALMLDFGIGVNTYEIKRADTDYFAKE